MTEGPSGAEREFWGSDRMSEVPYGKKSVEHETNKQTNKTQRHEPHNHSRPMQRRHLAGAWHGGTAAVRE
jgi:hypothetical protein